MLARSLNDDHSSQFKKCSKLSTSGQYKVWYLNPLTTNVPHHIETSQLICIANWLVFIWWGTLVIKWLKHALFSSDCLNSTFQIKISYHCLPVVVYYRSYYHKNGLLLIANQQKKLCYVQEAYELPGLATSF